MHSIESGAVKIQMFQFLTNRHFFLSNMMITECLQLMFASCLCLLFMVGEAAGGYLSNSLAIATDAAHLLTDFASFMVSLFAIWMAAKPRSARMSFGWHRAEVLGAIVSVLMIWVVTGILLYLAVLRVINQEFKIEAETMLITSGLGVLVNIVMGASLHQHGHSHGGDHQHDHQPAQQENINVKAAFIHVIGTMRYFMFECLSKQSLQETFFKVWACSSQP